MKVHELIAVLQDAPQNADVYINLGSSIAKLETGDFTQEWDDEQENYVVVL